MKDVNKSQMERLVAFYSAQGEMRGARWALEMTAKDGEPPARTCPVCEGDAELEGGEACPACGGIGFFPITAEQVCEDGRRRGTVLRHVVHADENLVDALNRALVERQVARGRIVAATRSLIEQVGAEGPENLESVVMRVRVAMDDLLSERDKERPLRLDRIADAKVDGAVKLVPYLFEGDDF